MAAADFTSIAGSEEQGYAGISPVEYTLAADLSPFVASSWKSLPVLPNLAELPLPWSAKLFNKSVNAVIEKFKLAKQQSLCSV